MELNRWEDLSRRIFVPFHDGIISQFEGYEDLEELDWKSYRNRYGDIGRLDRILEAEGDTPNRYRLSKQADVLMLFYLLSPGELTELSAVSAIRSTRSETSLVTLSTTRHAPRTARRCPAWSIPGSWLVLTGLGPGIA